MIKIGLTTEITFGLILLYANQNKILWLRTRIKSHMEILFNCLPTLLPSNKEVK